MECILNECLLDEHLLGNNLSTGTDISALPREQPCLHAMSCETSSKVPLCSCEIQ